MTVKCDIWPLYKQILLYAFPVVYVSYFLVSLQSCNFSLKTRHFRHFRYYMVTFWILVLHLKGLVAIVCLLICLVSCWTILIRSISLAMCTLWCHSLEATVLSIYTVSLMKWWF